MTVLVLAIALLAACGGTPDEELTPEAVTPATPEAVETQAATDTPAARLTPTAVATVETPAPPEETVAPTVPTAPPVSESDLEAGLELVREFLALLARGDYRDAYGTYLTPAGQQQLADLVLGRLSLPNPHISFFELNGAEGVDGQIVVDVTWEETYDGQGLVGTQQAQVVLGRQECPEGEDCEPPFLVEDMLLAEYEPAATPVPPPLPKAEAITNPAVPGEEMRFRASGFEGGETVLAWLELPDGSLLSPILRPTDGEGQLELAYSGEDTAQLEAGRWIWWVQALRDSTRNTGITFQVLEAPTPTVTPTRPPRPTTPPQPAAPTDTPTPEPSPGYPAPVLLWPEATGAGREYPGALVVEFVPVTGQLAADEFYEMILIARDPRGNVYNQGSVRGKGGPCDGQYGQPCVSLTGDLNFMKNFYPDGFVGSGVWFVQVVRETGPGQFTPVSPSSEQRPIELKPR